MNLSGPGSLRDPVEVQRRRNAWEQDDRFDNLRHTYASMLLDAGYEPRKVSHWMGHANLNTTYGHLYAADHEADSDRLDEYFVRSRAHTTTN